MSEAKSLGTFEAGSTFNLQPTLTDEDGTAIDLSAATILGFAEQNGAVYLNDATVATANDTVTAANGGAKWSFTATVSAKLPVGRVEIIFQSTVTTTVRLHRAFIRVVRGAHV